MLPSFQIPVLPLFPLMVEFTTVMVAVLLSIPAPLGELFPLMVEFTTVMVAVL
jgi:hypothetical protein